MDLTTDPKRTYLLTYDHDCRRPVHFLNFKMVILSVEFNSTFWIVFIQYTVFQNDFSRIVIYLNCYFYYYYYYYYYYYWKARTQKRGIIS